MKLKKVLAATLAATMVLSSAMTVSASGYYSSSSSSAPVEQPAPSSPVSSEPAAVKGANAEISVAGVAVKTSIAGAYAAKTVQGTAVTTPLADVKANLGLSDGQKPAITIYDTTDKQSPAAFASINAAAEALGGEVLTALNINLGAKENGKWVSLENGSIALATGLPKGADTTKTYCAICVQPGGEVTILEDQDTNPKTVTFEVKAGIGAYAIVAQ
ncbi:MAG: hypothetical protein K2I96_22675 [Lachnospiraceae bacterium]|nr:hypothetical protein [Lachnospiraceae bacterium]